MAERDLSGLRAYAHELSDQFEQVRTGMKAMQRDIAAVTGTAKSRDGFVTAVVGARGDLRELKLDGRIYRTPDAARLAETITDTVRRAAEDASAKVKQVAARYAPGADIASALRGDLTERLKRFDIIQDEVTGGTDDE